MYRSTPVKVVDEYNVSQLYETRNERRGYPYDFYWKEERHASFRRLRSRITGITTALSMRRKSSKLRVYDESWVQEEGAAATIQRMFRFQQARSNAEDTRLWEAFKLMDESHEWHTVARMERMKKLQSALLNIAGESISVDHAPRPVQALPCPTKDSILKMISGLRKGQRIPITDAIQIIEAGTVILSGEPTVNYTNSEKGTTVIIGDLHGSLPDLLHILDNFGLPGPGMKFIFNGDLVDRGEHSCEVLLLVLTLKLATPEAVFINRGNHEDAEVNVFYGFIEECRAKYDHRFYQLCSSLFDWLPLATCLNNEIAVLHGGLTSEEDFTLAELASFQRGPEFLMYRSQRQMKILSDIKWSDPHKLERWSGTGPSTRGKGIVFGCDATEAFLANNNLKLLVRSHEEQKTGYKVHHKGKLITVFSASNYGGHGNGAAVLVFGPDEIKPTVHKWEPFEKKHRRKKKDQCDSTKMMMNYIEESIVENHEGLLSFWRVIDKQNTGKVKVTDWVDGLKSELRLDSIPIQFRKSLLIGSTVGSDSVAYRNFLNHHKARHQNKVKIFGSQLNWHTDAVSQIATHLAASAIDFEKAFADADTSKTGVLSFEEFRVAVRKVLSFEVLSDQQIETLAEAFDRDGDGEISKDEFISRLRAVETESDQMVQVEWASDRRQERLRSLREQVTPMGQAHVTKILQEHDADGNGSLDCDELSTALTEGLGVPFDHQLYLDLVGILGTTDETPEVTLLDAAGDRAFPVVDTDIKDYYFNRTGFFSYVEYDISVKPDHGQRWSVRQRYREFDSLMKALKRHSSSLPDLPSSFPALTASAKENRKEQLNDWLKKIVKMASKNRKLRNDLRVFLRVPSGTSGNCRGSATPSKLKLSLPELVDAICAPTKACADETFTPALGNALLSLLYRYRQELKHLFYSRDNATYGVIPVEDFRATLVSLNELEGCPLTRAQLDALIKKVDTNRDGQIDYTEFEQAITKK
eukprot:TRINITY_DN4522_c1_g1_i1.p1 TRINITY_DN4522_c1_g1~~TRINITY_DN4522_c1_g1_i1.p1  ORF type:complete len:1075 (+),score=219.62 TRINITY_DN4522_c1_g1_i1:283-3225(+)